MLLRATLASLFLIATGWAGEEAPIALSGLQIGELRAPLLAEHLVLRLPAGSWLQEAEPENGQPAEPETRQTMVVMDAGEQRMVLMARELQRSTDDFEQRAARYYAPLAKEHGSLHVTALDPPSGGLHMLVLQPPDAAGTAAPVPLFWAAVANTDGSVQELSFYVNSAGATDLPAARSLARRILATLRPGPRRLPDAVHVQKLEVLGDDGLSLELPGGVAYSCQRGADYLVHHVELVVPLGEVGGSLGLYEGSAPKTLDDSLPHTEATILGHGAEWYLGESQGEQGTGFSADVIVPNPGKGVLHFFVDAPTPEARERLMHIAETLQPAR
jgi:hypothetical protein